jgi:hypothetical protein
LTPTHISEGSVSVVGEPEGHLAGACLLESLDGALRQVGWCAGIQVGDESSQQAVDLVVDFDLG